MTAVELIRSKMKTEPHFYDTYYGWNLVNRLIYEEMKHALVKAFEDSEVDLNNEFKKIAEIYSFTILEKVIEVKDIVHFIMMMTRQYYTEPFDKDSILYKPSYSWCITLFDTYYDGMPTAEK